MVRNEDGDDGDHNASLANGETHDCDHNGKTPERAPRIPSKLMLLLLLVQQVVEVGVQTVVFSLVFVS